MICPQTCRLRRFGDFANSIFSPFIYFHGVNVTRIHPGTQDTVEFQQEVPSAFVPTVRNVRLDRNDHPSERPISDSN